MKDTRLTNDELDVAVAFAYGGGAYREARRAQSRTLAGLIRRKRNDTAHVVKDARPGKA